MSKTLSKYKNLPPYLRWGEVTIRRKNPAKIVESQKHQTSEYTLRNVYKPAIVLYGTH